MCDGTLMLILSYFFLLDSQRLQAPPYCVQSVTQQVNSNTLQCSDCPFRILLLVIVKLAKEVPHESWIIILENGFMDSSHEVKLIVHVVHSEQMSPNGLLRSEVVDVCPCDA